MVETESRWLQLTVAKAPNMLQDTSSLTHGTWKSVPVQPWREEDSKGGWSWHHRGLVPSTAVALASPASSPEAPHSPRPHCFLLLCPRLTAFPVCPSHWAIHHEQPADISCTLPILVI